MANSTAKKDEGLVLDGQALSDGEVVDLFKNFSVSQPIRINTKQMNPNYAYRWISKRAAVYNRRRGVGWQVVKADKLEEHVAPGVSVSEVSLGTHTDAEGNVALADDLLLAYIPKRYAEAIKAHAMRLNQDRVQAGKRRFHETGDLLGGLDTYEVDHRGQRL